MKFKFLEPIAFIAVLFILFGGAKILLTNMERTSHLYDYSDVVKLAKQKDNTPDANTKVDEKKEDEKEKSLHYGSHTAALTVLFCVLPGPAGGRQALCRSRVLHKFHEGGA